jgi:Fe-S-cluster-containing hydrogenase component 2
VVRIDTEKCTNCCGCVDFCPMTAIVMIDDVVQIDSEVCMECEVCTKICPMGAVSVIR